ncbi:MAG: hypothetical protein N5P05_003596 [Chroococcopsis gigantea SAG 12.99]|jgi:predicted nucleotidyltransferase|nr:hypothetical protein [Chroococcopsis gigantea SAG 12.99]
MTVIPSSYHDNIRYDRYRQGRKIALEAAEFLRQKYHINEVILFGSLLQQSKFRLVSDIDLAVEGLGDDLYYKALRDLAGISSGFAIALVQLESAQPALKRVIKEQGIILKSTIPLDINSDSLKTKNANSVLLGQIQQELVELNELIERNQRLLDKLKSTGDEDYVGAIALNLHSFYTGVERIFKQIAGAIDGLIPDNPDWYRQLLRQMSAPFPSVRPSILSLETRTMLDDYCSFRHVVRNIYSFNLKVAPVEQLASDLPYCFDLLKLDMEKFMEEMS